MSIQETDKLDRARQQGQAQFDSIREMVEALGGWQAAAEAEGWSGPRTDKFGATFFDNDDGATWACASWRELCEGQGIEPSDTQGDARQAIEEDALSVEVRSGWNDPGLWSYTDARDKPKPEEYRILLCTGGPAVQIIGELSEYGEPETARMQVQDWFAPWTDFRPLVAPDNYDSEPILLTYARCFYFGE